MNKEMKRRNYSLIFIMISLLVQTTSNSQSTDWVSLWDYYCKLQTEYYLEHNHLCLKTQVLFEHITTRG